MPVATLKIQNARFIVTVDPQRRIIQDGSILVEGQRIAQVGKASELNAVPADRVMDASEMVVAPGFVNGHMHISYAHAVRGVFPDDLGRDYLPNVFRLQAVMTEDEEYYTSLLAITELLKYGTTCFLDPGSTKYLDRCLQAYQESGCRIIVGAQVVDRPNSLNLPVFKTFEAIDRVEQTISAYNNRLDGRIRAWAMPFSAALASPELLVAAKELADRYQTGLTLHHNNSATYVQTCLQQYGQRPTQYLESLGVLGPNVTLAHCLGIDQSEVDCLARTGSRVVMCPTAAIKGGAGMTHSGLLPEMLTQGIMVGLGTDAGNNSNLLESLRSMYLAAVLYKDGRQDVKVVPAESALEMATIGGAAALSLADDIGSIEVGKKADLVLFDTRRPEWRALFNPINSLVYNADGRSVYTVIIDGKVVVEGHRAFFVDEWELIQKVQAIGEALLSRTGVSYPSRWPVV
ncbi:MAG TPA: amidohydrolase [Dehalococcoidia bacterium]|jgi:cytosine/adenosine deaminase-related metal-dependent hydrolase|nr:amidohydrolase [Dehalococcoidia bacterium]